MKKILSTGFAFIFSLCLFAQPANLDSVRNELYKVNHVFDSSGYLAFDVNIVYSTDTSFGKFDYEEMSGRYILNNKNLYYRMGTTEYVQNDSFVFNIYHDEKMVMMTRDILSSNAKLFPLKDFLDSIVTWYGSSYTITLGYDADSSRYVEFKTNASDLPYKRFAVYYGYDRYYPERFEMSFNGGLPDLSDVPDSVLQLIKVRQIEKRITMNFTNYHNPTNLDVLNNSTYVFFERQRKKYRLVDRLKNYRFVTNGVHGNDSDETIEVASPDGN